MNSEAITAGASASDLKNFVRSLGVTFRNSGVSPLYSSAWALASGSLGSCFVPDGTTFSDVLA